MARTTRRTTKRSPTPRKAGRRSRIEHRTRTAARSRGVAAARAGESHRGTPHGREIGDRPAQQRGNGHAAERHAQRGRGGGPPSSPSGERSAAVRRRASNARALQRSQEPAPTHAPATASGYGPGPGVSPSVMAELTTAPAAAEPPGRGETSRAGARGPLAAGNGDSRPAGQAAAIAGEPPGPLRRARAIQAVRDRDAGTLASMGIDIALDAFRLVRAIALAPFRIARALRVQSPGY